MNKKTCVHACNIYKQVFSYSPHKTTTKANKKNKIKKKKPPDKSLLYLIKKMSRKLLTTIPTTVQKGGRGRFFTKLLKIPNNLLKTNCRPLREAIFCEEVMLQQLSACGPAVRIQA